MYKTRISHWRLGKNKKEEEMHAILRKAKVRQSEGRDTDFTLRGNPITLDEVYVYFERKGISRDRVEELDLGECATPKDVRYQTPVERDDRETIELEPPSNVDVDLIPTQAVLRDEGHLRQRLSLTPGIYRGHMPMEISSLPPQHRGILLGKIQRS